MPLEEKQLLPVAIYEGVHQDFKAACTFAAICQYETSLKIRHWYPEVKPNMDGAGTHNDLLCLELYREGLITDSKKWKKSRQWHNWRKLFQERPDIGTMISARAFSRLADKIGLDRAIPVWKTGRTNTVPGLLYAMQVKSLRAEMMQMCQR